MAEPTAGQCSRRRSGPSMGSSACAGPPSDRKDGTYQFTSSSPTVHAAAMAFRRACTYFTRLRVNGALDDAQYRRPKEPSMTTIERSTTAARVTRWALVLSGAIVAVSRSRFPPSVADAVSPPTLAGFCGGTATTAAKAASGSSTATGASWWCSMPRQERSSPRCWWGPERTTSVSPKRPARPRSPRRRSTR